MRLSPALALLASATLAAQDIGPTDLDTPRPPAGLDGLSSELCRMLDDQSARALCQNQGLELMSLTWEDTSRSKNSCWGENISDSTIQVLGQGNRPLSVDYGFMPVMRHPNFADVTCDIPIGRLKLLVGNEHGTQLHALDLASYLDGFGDYQHTPTGWVRGSLRCNRDQEVLVSAQACMLPVASGEKTPFAPVLFNYQSRPGNPAVLVILATPEGTSAQVIDDNGQACAGVQHGQRLFHNRNGDRALLSAERFSDHEAATITDEKDLPGGVKAAGLSTVLIIQIPLKHLPPPVYVQEAPQAGASDGLAAPAACPVTPQLSENAGARGMESAVIASGRCDGPWLGLDGCTIERDPAYPIRATVQFYQATDTSQLRPSDAARIGQAIARIYLDADAVGSLVTDGLTDRPTESQRAPAWPQPWWQGPCESYTTATGEAWADALARVRTRLGADWQPADERELRNALALVRR